MHRTPHKVAAAMRPIGLHPVGDPPTVARDAARQVSNHHGPRMTSSPTSPLTVGIGGLGAIGLAVAKRLDQGIPGLVLTAVSARDQARAAERVAGFKSKPAVVTLAELAERCAVVVECCPSKEFATVMEPAIARGRIVMPLSA